MRKVVLKLGVLMVLVSCRVADDERESVEAGEEEVIESTDAVLFDFGDSAAEARWFSIDDGVMGGVSSSSFETDPDGLAVFSGEVSLENNGGFASVRSAPGDHDLSGYAGIALRVQGDGKVYKLNLRLDREFDGVNYRARFQTQPGSWQTLRIPFADFQPSFRGRQVPDALPLDPSKIATFGFLISDRQAGAFALKIDWIGAWRAS